MKMHAILVEHGFGVIVAFCYNICLLRNSVVTVLKVIGCEDFVRESHFNAIWMTFRTFLEQLEKPNLRFGRV